MSTPFSEEPETLRLLERAANGDSEAAGELLERHRDRLARMVRLRLDPRVRGRIGVSDVLQEAYLEASQRMDEYFHNPEVPFYLWLRFIAAQRVLMVHRRHIGAKGRAVGREQRLDAAVEPLASSVSIAAELIGRGTSPTRAAARAELRERLAEALESMEPIDREVLVLRHFEQLSNVNTASILGLNPDAASKRYVRALRRLRAILGELNLGQEQSGGNGERRARRHRGG
jgi:RNA polymerase sigma-70 factor (ECF subfamily)